MGANWSALTIAASSNPNAPQIHFEGEKVVVGPVKPVEHKESIRIGSSKQSVTQFEMLGMDEIRNIKANSLGKIRALLLDRFGNGAGNAVFHQVFQNKLAGARPISSTEILLADKLGIILEKALQTLLSSVNLGNVKATETAKVAEEFLAQAFGEPLIEGVCTLNKQDAKALEAMVQEQLKVIEPILKEGNLRDAQGQLEAQLSKLRATQGYHRTVSNAFYRAVNPHAASQLSSQLSSQLTSQPPALPHTLEPSQSLEIQSDWQGQGDWESLIHSNDPCLLQGKTVAQQDAQELAKLCFQSSSKHPQAVQAILHFNQNVREAALIYLCSDIHLDPSSDTSPSTKLDPNEQRKQGEQKALALCYLQAGYPLDNILPPGLKYADSVSKLLQDRRKAQADYWKDHQEKHVRREKKNPGFSLPDRTQSDFKLDEPFFYSDSKKYSFEDRNNEIFSSDTPQEKFVCRHLQEVAAGNAGLTTKEFLTAMKNGDVSRLNYQELERASRDRNYTGLTINFSSEHFGALIRSLALGMQEGESRSFMVGWQATNQAGHAMRVFVEKTKPKEDGKEDGQAGEATTIARAAAGGIEAKEYEKISRIKVGLYDPSVTGNISHLKVLPEELASLGFNQFDKDHAHDQCNHDGVLSLHVTDSRLVDYYAGKFVNVDRSSQIASLGQAMSCNNLVEAKKALERLTESTGAYDSKGSATAPSKYPLTPPEQKRLVDGLFIALQDGHAKPLKAFLEALPRLKDFGLTAAQIQEILLAKRANGVPGLYMALKNGRTDAAIEYLKALFESKKNSLLNDEQVKSLLEAKNKEGVTGVQRAKQLGKTATADAFLAKLRELHFNEEWIKSLG